MTEHRSLPVPDGLEGERLDAALARMLGYSRTKAAALVEAGHVRLDGREPAKSERVRAGAWLELELPPAEAVTAASPLVPVSVRDHAR